MTTRNVIAISLALGAQQAQATADTPITKVLQLMQDMLAKGIKEKEEEANKFAAFSQWCSDQERIKTDEIETGNARMEELDAAIEKGASTIRQLTDRVQELEHDISRWEKDSKSATAVRERENADYDATLNDYQETLDALDEAIMILKKQAASTPQADLIQVVAKLRFQKAIPVAAKAALAAFLQQGQPSVDVMPDDDLFHEAPQAYAYEFQSGGIVDMLVKLKNQFADKKAELMKEELNAKHNFELILQQLTDEIENAKHEVANKKTISAQTQQQKAADEGELTVTTKERDSDKGYLADAQALCQQKSTDFKSRQDLRANEIQTIKQAIDIISSDSVAGAGEKHLPVMLQSASWGKSAALSQLRAEQVSPIQSRIAEFLSERAKVSGSRLLSQVAQRVSSDPFTKVKKLIKDLIVNLMEEATAETEHKGWCDTELATNKLTRDKKAAEVNSLTNEVEDLTAEIAKLTQEIADLATAVKELDAAMASATEERTSSKATNEQTIKEAKEAQAAVEQAAAIVKAYYAKSAEATSFAQQKQAPADDAPETFSAPYKGMLPEGGNVVDFLEVILSDFVRLESETTSAEEGEQQQYETFMFESKKDKALKENDSEHKTERRVDRESALHQAQEDLKMAQEQLDKALAYFDKLKPTCVHSGVSYEERVKQREAEIQSLQEALKILSGSDIA